MAGFTTLTAVALPLLRNNVDTDAIIPSREMKTVGKSGLADGLFAGWRYRSVGSRDPDPGFVLNDPRYREAKILLSGENFGCGSSREHAVWALAEYGFRVIVAPSFNPIFRGNCINNGLLPVMLPADVIGVLAEASAALPAPMPLTVDLENSTVHEAGGGRSHVFDIDDDAKQMLLRGMDAIDVTLAQCQRIEAFRDKDRTARPWIYL